MPLAFAAEALTAHLLKAKQTLSQRETVLAGERIAYRLERARRRSIGFVVDADGLTVRAPAWVTLGAIESALQEKSAWIVRKLAEVQARTQRQQAARIVWRDGAVLPWRGTPITLRLGAARGATRLEGGVLQLGIGTDAPPEAVRRAVHAWVLREARAHFSARLAHFAPLLGVRWQRLQLSNAATRWGSASVSGAIRLNWRLMHYRDAVIDYVVVHELAHLREMNHSPRFWAIVAGMVPDHALLRRELRERIAPVWE